MNIKSFFWNEAHQAPQPWIILSVAAAFIALFIWAVLAAAAANDRGMRESDRKECRSLCNAAEAGFAGLRFESAHSPGACLCQDENGSFFIDPKNGQKFRLAE